MPRIAVIVDHASHFAGLRRGMMFLVCGAAICAALVVGAEGRSAKGTPATVSAQAGQP